MTYQKGDSEKSIFGLAYKISYELTDMYPECVFSYFCEPPRHITVIIMHSDIQVFHLLYLLWLLRQPADKTEDPKRDLLSFEAKNMVADIEKLIKDYGGRKVDLWVLGTKSGFWYSGPFFDAQFLDEDAYAVGAGIGMHREIVVHGVKPALGSSIKS
jgi:hypothetical protein